MSASKEGPIPFSAPMVLAILAGRKDVTRRLVKLPEGHEYDGHNAAGDVFCSRQDAPTGSRVLRCPYAVGMRLWVKEAHTITVADPLTVIVRYHADGATSRPELSRENCQALAKSKTVANGTGRPPMFMFRWASRISLEITGVRVERLHAITDQDAKREGVRRFFEILPGIGRDQTLTSGERAADAEYRAGFAVLWDELNDGRATWKSNPFVRRVAFRRVSP